MKQIEPRTYRNHFRKENLVYFSVKVKEADVLIGLTSSSFYSDLPMEMFLVLSNLIFQLETYISRNPEFQTSLVPLKSDAKACPIVKDMLAASEIASTGPMAAVAGAVNLHLAKALVKNAKPEEWLIENGGDVYYKFNHEANFAIYAGNSPLSGQIGIKIPRSNFPVGVCTSSGTVGHSFSFGKADAACVVCRDVCLADAFATQLGNRISKPEDLEINVTAFATNPLVTGTLAVLGDRCAMAGDIQFGLLDNNLV